MSSLADKKVVILVSGGPDSKTLAQLASAEGANIVGAIYLRSGHASDEQEIASARQVAEEHNINIEIIDVGDIVEKLGGGRPMMHAGARLIEFGSAIMLSISVAYAMRIEAELVLIGLHKDDAECAFQYSLPFIEGLSELAARTGDSAPRIEAPFINMTKVDVFRLGRKMGVDYSKTWSCTTDFDVHCGYCTACQARREAFLAAGITDETKYLEVSPAATTVTA